MRSEPKGRGAKDNIKNRFENSTIDRHASYVDDDFDEDFQISSKTNFIVDHSQSIVTENNSPDLGFRFTLNAYRGCEHGCIYCYARPTHEYLGLSAGLDFESKIFFKPQAPLLLKKKLMSKSWQPEVIMISGVTDCYQPVEKKFELTRQCLKVLAEFKNPVCLVTKNYLVTRDIDLLKELAQSNAVIVYVSVTTLDNKLCSILEPRTSRPQRRLQAIFQLSQNGIPVGVNVAPVIPGLTDMEMPRILEEASKAGAKLAGVVPLRLPYAVAPLFVEWLEKNFPERKVKILNQIRSMRGGQLYDSNWEHRMTGQGAFAQNIKKMFHVCCRKFGLNLSDFELSTQHFQRPESQLSWDMRSL